MLFNDDDVVIFCVDSEGQELSCRVYSGENEVNEDVIDVVKMQDDYLMLVGLVCNFVKVYIIKSDFNGDMFWICEIEVSFDDNVLNVLMEFFDGNFVVMGYVLFLNLDLGILVMKFILDGEILWIKILGDEFCDNCFGEDIIEMSDGSLVVVGYCVRGGLIFGYDMLIIKFDGEGNYFINLLSGKVFWLEDGCNFY